LIVLPFAKECARHQKRGAEVIAFEDPLSIGIRDGSAGTASGRQGPIVRKLQALTGPTFPVKFRRLVVAALSFVSNLVCSMVTTAMTAI
jgi:hypothetical protein